MNLDINISKCTRVCVIFIAISLLMVSIGIAKPTVIKVAVVMPDGSTWVNTLNELSKEVKKKTNKEVVFRIYAGGISGDEEDVLRKMRVNRIHAAGFSGVGLGIVVPEIRILESVLTYHNYEELDTAKNQLFDTFKSDFDKKGFVLLGFFDGGAVYLFSKRQMTTETGLKSIKMWTWKSDQIAQLFLKNCGVEIFPLHMSDVTTGLETGMIDSFYCPPLAAVALQWYSKVKYMLDYPVCHSIGAFLLNKRTFQKLSPKNRRILEELTLKYCQKLVKLTRRDNEDSMEILKSKGIVFEKPTASQIKFFNDAADRTVENCIPTIFSRSLYNQVQAIVKK